MAAAATPTAAPTAAPATAELTSVEPGAQSTSGQAAASAGASARKPAGEDEHPAGLAGALAGLLALKSGDVPPVLKAELAGAEATDSERQQAAPSTKRTGKRALDSATAETEFPVPPPKVQQPRAKAARLDANDADAGPSQKRAPPAAEDPANAAVPAEGVLSRRGSTTVGAPTAPAGAVDASAMGSLSSSLSNFAQLPIAPMAASSALNLPGSLLPPPRTPTPGVANPADLAMLEGLAANGGHDFPYAVLQHLRNLACYGLTPDALVAPEVAQTLSMALGLNKNPELLPNGSRTATPVPHLPVPTLSSAPSGTLLPAKPVAVAPGSLMPGPLPKATPSAQGSLSGTGMGSVETSTYDGAASHEVASHQGNGSECCSVDVSHEQNLLTSVNIPMRPHSTPPGLLYLQGVGSMNNLKSSMGSLANLSMPLMAGLTGLSTSKSSTQLRPSTLKRDDADDRTLQRRARNRDAARRTRLKKMLLLQGGEARVTSLADTLEAKGAVLADLQKRIAAAETLNSQLKARVLAQATGHAPA